MAIFPLSSSSKYVSSTFNFPKKLSVTLKIWKYFGNLHWMWIGHSISAHSFLQYYASSDKVKLSTIRFSVLVRGFAPLWVYCNMLNFPFSIKNTDSEPSFKPNSYLKICQVRLHFYFKHIMFNFLLMFHVKIFRFFFLFSQLKSIILWFWSIFFRLWSIFWPKKFEFKSGP